MHRARCGLLFNATALPLGAAAAPNFFPCDESREFSSRQLSYSRIKSKRLKQRSFASVARERAVLQAHEFKHLFQIRGDTKVHEIAMH